MVHFTINSNSVVKPLINLNAVMDVLQLEQLCREAGKQISLSNDTCLISGTPCSRVPIPQSVLSSWASVRTWIQNQITDN